MDNLVRLPDGRYVRRGAFIPPLTIAVEPPWRHCADMTQLMALWLRLWFWWLP